jgi:hypothetical protein
VAQGRTNREDVAGRIIAVLERSEHGALELRNLEAQAGVAGMNQISSALRQLTDEGKITQTGGVPLKIALKST